MRSEYLKYVVDTAEQGSIALAAKKNFISPQGLGRAIAVVEDELGFEIFHRTANSLSLTPKGKRIFPAISRAVQSMSMLHAEALKLLDDERSAGSIVFCSSIVFMSGMISRLYSDFADTSFNLRYVQLSTERIIEAFCTEENTYGDLGSSVGIALFFNPGSDASQAAITRLLAHGGEYRPYIEYEDGVLLPESSPLATKEKITHADLEEQNIISSSAEQRPFLEQRFGANAVKMVVPDVNFRRNLVRDGKGVTFFPTFIGRNQEAEGTVFRTFEQYQRIQLGFVCLPGFFSLPLGRAVLQSFDSYYQPLAEEGQVWML